MASALIDLMRFTEAEPLLLSAAEQCEKSAQARRMHWPKVLKSTVKLYDTWHAAEPGKGYDAKAGQWRARLAAVPA